MAFPDFKALRFARAVIEGDLVEFTNRELIPLIKQIRDWLQALREGAQDGYVWTVVDDGNGGTTPGWQPVEVSLPNETNRLDLLALVDDGASGLEPAWILPKSREQQLTASTLSPAGTIDFSLGLRVHLELDTTLATLTLLIPSDLGAEDATHITLFIKQPDAGTVKVVTAWAGDVYFRDNTDPVLATTLGQWDIIAAYSRGADGTMSFVHSGPFGPV